MSVQVVLVFVVIGGVAVHRMAVTENAKRPAGRGATAKLTAVAAIHNWYSKTLISRRCKCKHCL